MLQLADLVMVGQVGRAQPAALLLQLIQLVLHVVPLLTHTPVVTSLHKQAHAEAHRAGVAFHPSPANAPASVAYGHSPADAAAHPANVAYVA